MHRAGATLPASCRQARQEDPSLTATALTTAADRLCPRAARVLRAPSAQASPRWSPPCCWAAAAARSPSRRSGPIASALPVREVLEPVQPLPLQPQVEALDAHRFNLFRSDAVRATDTAEVAAGPPGRQRPGGRRLPAAGRRRRAPSCWAAPAARVTRRSHRRPRPGAPDRALGRRRRRPASSAWWSSATPTATSPPASKPRPLAAVAARWAAAPSAARCSPRSTMPASPTQSPMPARRHLLRRHRLPPRPAQGRPLRRGVRDARSRRRAAAHRPRAVAPSSSTTARRSRPCGSRSRASKGGYYDFDGKSLHQRLPRLADGVLARHQRLRDALPSRSCNSWRAHLGVDYGAPTGTPVRTVGDGMVEFAGVQNGYGNVVMVNHGNGDITRLRPPEPHRRAPGPGASSQGQRIGAVGATGWATGPHLHFEFRVNGVHQDPIEVAAPAARAPTLSAAAAAGLRRSWPRAMRTQLAAAAAPTRSPAPR